MQDRQSENQKIVRVTKHFFKISNSDSNDYESASHNPGNTRISFNNQGITNVQSAHDSTITRMSPISFTIDMFYNNIDESFGNNKFHVKSAVYAGGLGSLSQGGVREGTGGFLPLVTLDSGIYKTGAALGAEVLRALNAAAISWHGGNQIVWTNTGFDAGTNSIRFRYATAAPAGTPELIILCNVQQGSKNYDASRILGIDGNTRELSLPYATTQGAGAGVAGPNYTDLQTLQTIQVRSNIAKRFFMKLGSSLNPAQRPLSLTDILFEIPTDPASLGSTLVWTATDERYAQQIESNFDQMSIVLTDKFGDIVTLTNNAEWSFLFSVERDVVTYNNQQRIETLTGEYSKFKQF
jgi:hypothetical protein